MIEGCERVHPSKGVVEEILTLKVPSNVRGDVFRLKGLTVRSSMSALKAMTVTTRTVAGVLRGLGNVTTVNMKVNLVAMMKRYLKTNEGSRTICCVGGLDILTRVVIITDYLLIFTLAVPIAGLNNVRPRDTEVYFRVVS